MTVRNVVSKARKALSKARWGLAVGGSLAVGTVGCSRDHIEAVNLANAGDQAVKVNVAGAIKNYEEAIRLDSENHRILWKLANAYQKQEEWSKMESTLSQAMTKAPENADYAFRRGYALVKIAQGGNKDAYTEAQGPLKKCVELDPNYAECYFWLGETYLWTGNDQEALANYTKAVEHNPKEGYFYVPPGVLYTNLRMYDAADKLLKEGERVLDKVQKNKDDLYNIYTQLANVAQGKGNKAGQLAALEQANALGGDSHPEVAFNLGSTYAVMDPPQKDNAIRLLKSFNKRVCKGAKAATTYKQNCEQSQSLVQKLGGDE